MSSAPGPVYEVSLSIDREVAEAFDDWLASRVRDLLELPGFVRAVTFAADDENPERVRRITQCFLETDEALEEYLSGPADAMRQEAESRFPDRFSASRRVLHHADSTEETSAPVEACLNCGTLLTGQYCANCGQRARSRLISIWELVRDAVGDLFELDSRLWRTIIPLTVRPGKLTREYLMGRRARFMPPFRTYLVLSVVFFLVAFFDPREQLGLLFEPVESTESEQAAQVRREVLEDRRADGVIVGEPREESTGDNEAEETGGLNIDCQIEDLDNVQLPQWLARRLTAERLAEMCERVTADRGRAFVRQLLDNIPASLFILLPLMALVLKMLYPLSKRYYAEHLLFVLHFHAFLFLVLTVDILITRFTQLVALDAVGDLMDFVVSLYIPVYLYKSLRRVYDQGRPITLLKFIFLLLSYFVGLLVILMFVMVYTAISI
jgi:hypothetical protein